MQAEKNMLAYIKSKGITIKHLSDSTGIGYRRLYDALIGRTDMRADDYIAIMEELDVTASELQAVEA